MKSRRPKRVSRAVSKVLLPGIFVVAVIILLYLAGRFLPELSSGIPEVSNAVPPVFERLTLSARAAYVFDIKTGKEIFGLNSDTQLPLASLNKIMMAVTALSLLPPESVVTINPAFLQTEGDSGLYGNERWRLKDLLDLTLLESSNDGANAIAATAGQIAAVVGYSGHGGAAFDLGRQQFVAAMNKKAVELSLSQTYFLNPTGLDLNADLSGGYGSARDVARLFSYALTKYPKLFGATRYEKREFESLSALKHSAKNTNVSVAKIPSLLGSKTGYTDLAGGNLVVAFDAGPNRPVVISVLGSTEVGRFEDAEKLVWATLNYLSNQDL